MKTKLQFVIRHSSFVIALALCAVAQIASGVTAFSYQGRLMNAAGTAALTGNQKVELRLYNSPTGGTPLWGRTYSVLLDASGLFNIEASDATGSALSGTSGNTLEKVFALNANTTIYVGLTVDGTSGEIQPRQKLLAVPYATFANDVSQAKADFTVTGTLTAKNVTVQNTLTAASVNVTGAASASTLTTSGAATIKGNLTVNGTLNGIGLVPVKGIIMWSGSTVPEGWALCDGQNGTPDLRGRFIVGAGQGSGLSYYGVDYKGGEERHKLTVDEMPSHNHSYGFRGADIDDDWKAQNNLYSLSYSVKWNTAYTDYTGGDQSHENRPPYYALAFIMRTK